MKLLVLGGTGMLGHMACRVLAGRFEMHATFRRPPPRLPVRWHRFDAAAPGGVEALLEAVAPDAVLNAVGVVKQQVDAPADAIRLNALLPHELAAACTAVGARLVHLSTDCVFSGIKGGYRESDPPDPVDRYGRTKHLGEVGAPHLTLRTSWVGPELSAENGLLARFLARARAGATTFEGWSHARWSGLSSRALCTLIGEVIAEHRELAGLYHVAAEPLTKLELLTKVGAAMSLPIAVVPSDVVRIDRTLDGSRFVRATGLVAPSWDVMIRQIAEDLG